jgi:putative transposase
MGDVTRLLEAIRGGDLSADPELLSLVRSITSDRLEQLILIGEPSRRRAVEQFCEDYHRERTHQGLENKIIEPEFGSAREGELNCRERLGGLLRYYYRDAA